MARKNLGKPKKVSTGHDPKKKGLAKYPVTGGDMEENNVPVRRPKKPTRRSGK